MRFLTADTIYPISSAPLSGKVLVVGSDGSISAIIDAGTIDSGKVEHYEGFICPGFVNTHCHLELSYMKGTIDPGGGLHHFIKEVEKLKKPADEAIAGATADADQEMHRKGIVAVGDICNTSHTFKLKERSPLYYHNFLEVYAFDPARAQAAFDKGLQLRQLLPAGGPCAIVPHAPYSVSAGLLELIAQYALKHNSILSMHNQETPDEDRFFLEKKGSILERLQYFGIDTSRWEAPGTTSLRYVLPRLPAANKLLLVHNTFTPQADVHFAQGHHKNLYWCLCPNANLFIEECLPDIDMLRKNNCRITLGTDSYASNRSLNILDEIRTIQKQYPALPLEELLKWATWNGAEFLQIQAQFGSIEINKRPGLNLVSRDLTQVTKLF